MKTKQDVFELLQEQYGIVQLQETDVTTRTYGKRLGISWRQAKRLLEKAVEAGIVLKELVLNNDGKRVNRYIPAPEWEKKISGNIFTQIPTQNGLKPNGNSNSTKRRKV